LPCFDAGLGEGTSGKSVAASPGGDNCKASGSKPGSPLAVMDFGKLEGISEGRAVVDFMAEFSEGTRDGGRVS
jgi:hypothetical protein